MWVSRRRRSLSQAELLEVQVATLFAAGEQGVWYDPSDLSTLFQDAAGTIPVTAAGQPVGCMLDKSGRGNHATQAVAASRPTLLLNGGGRYCLQADGLDDGLATAAINFTATAQMSVWAGVRKLSDAALGMLLELSADETTINGAIALRAPNSASANYGFCSRGTLHAQAATGASFAAPISNVLCGISAIATDSCILRANGVQVASSATDQGTGNYGTHPLYLFRRAATSLPFNGYLYGLIVRGATSSAAQISSGELYLAGKSGVTL